MQNEGTDTGSGSRKPVTESEAQDIHDLTTIFTFVRSQIRDSHASGLLVRLRAMTERARSDGFVSNAGRHYTIATMPVADLVATTDRLLKELEVVETCAKALLEIKAGCGCNGCIERRAAEKRDAGGWVPPEDKPLVGVKPSKAAT
jgi:hypothetical protein